MKYSEMEDTLKKQRETQKLHKIAVWNPKEIWP